MVMAEMLLGAKIIVMIQASRFKPVHGLGRCNAFRSTIVGEILNLPSTL
jgi:hypothetical protein